MNSNAQKWVAALRSGEHEQTTGFLCRINTIDGAIGFCCLGVACELYQKEGGKFDFVEEKGGIRSYEDCPSVLPNKVLEWLGLLSPRGTYGLGLKCLSELNDSGRNFLHIADIIESEPKGLFADKPPESGDKA